MHKNNKKGFTIVELVIVIAVIAILAAVLIPTFASLAKRANISADTQLIRNLNTALISDSAKNGTHTTMQSALDAAEKFGYDVAKINASATDNEILWDSANDVFCYFNAETNDVEYIPETALKTTPDKTSNTYWCIIKATSENVTCGKEGMDWSCYLASSTNSELKTSTGIDVGTLTNVTSITYDRHEVIDPANGQTVVIRTNSFDTTLTIDAAADTVKHYGEVGSLNIKAVANASYHENGTVQFVEISKGRIALEAGAEVSHIHINAKANVQEGENAFYDVIISYASTVDLTEVGFSRDDVEIDEIKGTLVVALQAGTETPTESTEMDYVWLTKQGIYEQIVVSDNGDAKENTGASQVEWVDTSNKSDETKDAAQKIANNIGANVTLGEKEYAVTVTQDNNRDLILAEVDAQGNIKVDEETGAISGQTYEIEINSQGQTVIDTGAAEKTVIEAVEAQPDKTEVKAAATEFAGGKGTESDPWIVTNADHIRNIGNHSTDSENHYWKVKDGITEIDCNNWVSVDIKGSFDGNNVTFNNLSATLFGTVGSQTGKANTIKNFTVNAQVILDDWNSVVVYYNAAKNTTYENITVHGYLEGATGVATYIQFGSSNAVINFKNCESDLTIVATSGCACGFIAHPLGATSVNLINSHYNGSMSTVYNSNNNNCYVNGNYFTGVTFDEASQRSDIQWDGGYNGHYHYLAEGKTSNLATKTGTLPENIGDVIVTTAEPGASRAIISIIISPNDVNETGCYTQTFITEAAIKNGSFSSDDIKYFNVRVNPDGITESGIHGNNFDIVGDRWGHTLGGNTFVKVTQYDTLGNVICVTTYNFNDAD